MQTKVERGDNEASSTHVDQAARQVVPQGSAVFDDLRPLALAQRQHKKIANAGSRLDQQRTAAEAVQRKTDEGAAAPNRTGLPDRLKAGIESLSGISMDGVKVHYNSSQPAQLNAHAYAQGSEIHLGPGQERHLPHEAWHVVQQKQGRVRSTMQRKGNIDINDDAGLEAEADIMGVRALQLPPADGVKLVHAAHAGATVQGLFWEKRPDGQYVWHEGPVIPQLWKERMENGTQETKPGNGWIHRGDYGVWDRKSVLDAVTDRSPLLQEGVPAVRALAREPTVENAEQQLGAERSANVAYAAKVIGVMLGVGAIVTIGATFVTFSLPAWVSPASRVFSMASLAGRFGKWWYDVSSATRRDESTFRPHIRNSAFVTLSFVQAAVELGNSGGKYVFLTSGWHHELYELLSAIKNAYQAAPPQAPVGADNA